MGELNVFRRYLRCFTRHTGPLFALAVGLQILIALLEGGGLFTLLSLLKTIGVGSSGQTGTAAASIGQTGLLTRLHEWQTALGLPLILVLFGTIKVGQAGLRAVSGILNVKLETEFTCFLRERLYRAMVRADWLFVTRQRSSDISQAIMEELQRVGFGTQQLLSLISQLVLVAIQVAVAVVLSPALAAIALGSGAVIALGLHPLRQRAVVLGEGGRAKRAEMASAVSEHLAGMKIAKSHGRETHHFDHFRNAMRAIADHWLRTHRLNALTGIWLQVGALLAMIGFVYYAVAVAHYDVARLLLLAFIFNRLMGLFSGIQNAWQRVAHSMPSFTSSENMFERFSAAAEPPAPSVAGRIALTREIRLDHVTFNYGDRPTDAINDLTFTIPARQVVALCGPSGAGKSTTADLLLGLLTPTRGRVLIDGEPPAGPRLHDWRRSIGYVPQETFLFHDTVRANLGWAQPGATEAEVRAALRAAAAESFVDALPQGLDTVLGDRGVRLSGGERQRIALARALLRRPTLLVLDEATSALDSHNERLVQDAIERLHGELTIVIIAHRLSTVRRADRIVVMQAGRVVETGTWDQLAENAGGAFSRLLAVSAGT